MKKNKHSKEYIEKKFQELMQKQKEEKKVITSSVKVTGEIETPDDKKSNIIGVGCVDFMEIGP